MEASEAAPRGASSCRLPDQLGLSRDSRLQISERRQRVMTAAAWRRYGLAAVALMAVLSPHLASSAKTHRSFVRKTVASHDIVIFSKSYCPYCKKAKAVFKELNSVPYVVELDQREDGSDIQDALSEIVGRRTVPQVFIHGKHMGGSDDTVEAYESGRLKELLKIDSKDDL